MNNIQEYINSTIKFVSSLVFKFELHRNYINKLWYKLYNYTPNNPKEEKYYLNLAGLKTPYDPDVYIYLGEKSEYVKFDKDFLLNYPNIKQDLLMYGDNYKRLINENPYMVTYILGCLYDIDIDKAIKAEDGSLLYYNKNFLGVNEINILNDIEDFVKKILYSYNIKEYTIDELYIHALTSLIYTNLPNFILAKKVNNLLTYKADNFNMLNHIISFGGINSDNYSFMNLPSLIWLYGNRNYIKTNIGKNEILNSVLENIYANNQVGINKLYIKNMTPKLLENNLTDPTKSIYTKDKIISTTKGNIYGNNDDKYTLEEILTIEKNNNYINENIDDRTVYELNKLLSMLGENDIITKDLLFNKSELLINKYKTTIELLVPVFMLSIQNISITSSIIYQNPENNVTYTFTRDQLVILYIFGMLRYLNLDTDVKIDNIIISFDYTQNTPFDNIIDKLYLKDMVKPYYDYIVELKKSIPIIIDIESMGNIVNTLSDILFKIKTINDNISDITLLHDFNIIINELFPTATISLPNEGMSIKEYITTYFPEMLDIDSEMAGYLIKDISKRIFKLEIDEMEILKDIFNKYLKVGNVYKSYTIKYIYSTEDSVDILTNNIPLNIGHNYKSFFNLKEGRYRRYDKLYFDTNTITYPINDNGPIEFKHLLQAQIETGLIRPVLKTISKSIMMLNDNIVISIMRYIDKLNPDIKTVSSTEINNKLTVIDNVMLPNIETYGIKEKSITSNNKDEDYIREIEPFIIIHK